MRQGVTEVQRDLPVRPACARARCWLLHGVKLRAIRGEEEGEGG